MNKNVIILSASLKFFWKALQTIKFRNIELPNGLWILWIMQRGFFFWLSSFSTNLPVLQIFQYLLFLFFQIFIFEYRKPINI